VVRINRALSLYERLGFVRYALDPQRTWMVHDPDQVTSPDARLVRAAMRRGSRHGMRLRDGTEMTGRILAVERRRVRFLPESGERSFDFEVEQVDLESLRYDARGWVTISAEPMPPLEAP